jgi:predicted dehydrogenase
VVQDKLWLPGLVKLKWLIDQGFFGKILSVRGEFGYWVFTGEFEKLQRPSWNYRKEDDGGIIVDMVCHWQYVIQNLFGDIKSLTCLGATHIPQRWDEAGKPYKCTADDAAYATFELTNGVDLPLQLLLDDPRGPRRPAHAARGRHARHGRRRPARLQGPVHGRDAALRLESRHRLPDQVPRRLVRVPDQQVYDNAFKIQWELFLKHVVTDSPFPWTLHEGAKGVQLAELEPRVLGPAQVGRREAAGMSSQPSALSRQPLQPPPRIPPS